MKFTYDNSYQASKIHSRREELMNTWKVESLRHIGTFEFTREVGSVTCHWGCQMVWQEYVAVKCIGLCVGKRTFLRWLLDSKHERDEL